MNKTTKFVENPSNLYWNTQRLKNSNKSIINIRKHVLVILKERTKNA